VSNNTKYIKGIQNRELPNTIETLSKSDRFNEYIMTGLRTIWGVSFNKVESDFGLEYLQYLRTSSEKFREQDLLVIANTVKQSSKLEENSSLETPRYDRILKVTKKGKFLVDGIASELFMI
jgi:oxygen-independent coproporphyrinogen-3 oxidase